MSKKNERVVQNQIDWEIREFVNPLDIVLIDMFHTSLVNHKIIIEYLYNLLKKNFR